MATQCKVSVPSYGTTGKGRNVPDWAMKIAAKECRASKLTLTWIQKSKGRYVTGRAWSFGRIFTRYGVGEFVNGPCVSITACVGACERYRLYVLLHEIAHVNVGVSHDHDKVWQAEAIRLYRKYKLLDEGLAGRWYGYECERKALAAAIARRDAHIKPAVPA